MDYSGHNGGEDMNGNIDTTECTELADASRFLGGGWVSDDEEFDDDFDEDSDEDMLMEDASSAQEVQLDETVENVPQMQSTATAANPVVSNSERKSDTTRNKLRQRKIHRYSKKPLTPSPSIPRPVSKARCVSCTAKGVQCDDAGQGCTNCREMGIKCQYPSDIDGKSLHNCSISVIDDHLSALRLGNLPKLTAEQEIELAALKNLIEKEKTEHPTTQGQGQRSEHNKKCASCKSLSLKCEPLGAPCTRCQTLGVRCRYSWQYGNTHPSTFFLYDSNDCLAGKWYMLRELTKAEEKLLNPRAELDRERDEQFRNNHQNMRNQKIPY